MNLRPVISLSLAVRRGRTDGHGESERQLARTRRITRAGSFGLRIADRELCESRIAEAVGRRRSVVMFMGV